MTGMLERIVRYGLYATPLAVLVVSSSLLFPFVTGKNFAFRIAVTILAVGWVFLVVNDDRFRLRSSAVGIAIAVFVGAVALATAFGLDPYRGFWSIAERMEGLVGLLFFALFFVIAVSVFQTKKHWAVFWSVWLGVGTYVGLHALVTDDGRIAGVLGNPIYLGIYALANALVAFWFATQVRNMWARAGLVTLALVHLFVMLQTGTRGAFLGLAAGAVVCLLIVALLNRGVLRRWALVGLVIAVIVPVGLVAARDTAFVQNTPTFSRVTNIPLSVEEIQEVPRVMVWQMGLAAWRDRPVLGWGLESFNYIFSSYYDPRLWNQEPWFDRSHNIFLDWLVHTGIVGFVAYLGLFAAAGFVLWKLWRRRAMSALQIGIIAGGGVAYAVHNFFVFDNFASSFLFFAVLGTLYFYDVSSREEERERSVVWQFLTRGMMRHVFVSVVLVGAVWSLFVANIAPIRAGGGIVNAMQAFGQRPITAEHIERGMDIFQGVIASDTFLTNEARDQLAQRVTRVIRSDISDVEKDRFTAFVISELEEELEQHPTNIRIKTFLASAYNAVGMHDEALAVADELIEIAPTRQTYHEQRGEALVRSGREEEGIESYRTAFELEESNTDVLISYALSLMITDRVAEGEALLEEHFDTLAISSDRLFNFYVSRERYDHALAIAEVRLEEEPEVLDRHLAVAQLHINLGDRNAAIAVLERAGEEFPEYTEQAEEFIRQLRQ